MPSSATKSAFVPFRTRLFAVLLCLCVGSAPCFAIGGGGGGKGGGVPNAKPTDTFRVAWKSLSPGKPLPDDASVALLILWFPASHNGASASPLHRSAELTALGARGVVNGLVTPGNQGPRKFYDIPSGQEVVVIVDRNGIEFGRVVAERSQQLSAEQVEELVRTTLKDRESQLEALFIEADKKQAAGNARAATEDLNTIWAERGLFASLGKKAAEKLKTLGVTVDLSDSDKAVLEHAGAPLSSADLQAVRAALEAGLKAEIEARYAEAEEHYVRAVTLAPNDATALRFLGEFHRHQTGRWDRAGRLFNQILDNPADPIARAVALNGLGRMTIHAGNSPEGLALLEKSIEAYPLPITCRNLAAHWFSEKKMEKASAYMQQALILDPDDIYNQIFAAAYLAASGYTSQALRIARTHEQVLEASYNLAAIWAQAGDRAKSLELLNRQFNTYEHCDPVRAMDMKEAREDRMFANLHADPSFNELTKDAKTAWMTGREFCPPEELRPLAAPPAGPGM